jgi:hypothetical protein
VSKPSLNQPYIPLLKVDVCAVRPLNVELPAEALAVDQVFYVTWPMAVRRCCTSNFRGAAVVVVWEVCGRMQWVCYAYCLMTNRYHLVVETPLGNLAKGLRHLYGFSTQLKAIAASYRNKTQYA